MSVFMGYFLHLKLFIFYFQKKYIFSLFASFSLLGLYSHGFLCLRQVMEHKHYAKRNRFTLVLWSIWLYKSEIKIGP